MTATGGRIPDRDPDAIVVPLTEGCGRVDIDAIRIDGVAELIRGAKLDPGMQLGVVEIRDRRTGVVLARIDLNVPEADR